jgi:hypothetical protein
MRGSAYFSPKSAARVDGHDPIKFALVEVRQPRGRTGDAGGVHDHVDRTLKRRRGDVAMDVRSD